MGLHIPYPQSLVVTTTHYPLPILRDRETPGLVFVFHGCPFLLAILHIPYSHHPVIRARNESLSAREWFLNKGSGCIKGPGQMPGIVEAVSKGIFAIMWAAPAAYHVLHVRPSGPHATRTHLPFGDSHAPARRASFIPVRVLPACADLISSHFNIISPRWFWHAPVQPLFPGAHYFTISPGKDVEADEPVATSVAPAVEGVVELEMQNLWLAMPRNLGTWSRASISTVEVSSGRSVYTAYSQPCTTPASQAFVFTFLIEHEALVRMSMLLHTTLSNPRWYHLRLQPSERFNLPDANETPLFSVAVRGFIDLTVAPVNITSTTRPYECSEGVEYKLCIG
ncbi:hypothetical protein BU15DRAFT_80452 [Melanogaster broomeanus]|nr:hypothetical protein BU15DRAFT_80452 [Melanogaster broomeanus]